MKKILMIVVFSMLLLSSCAKSQQDSLTVVPNITGVKLGKAQEELGKVNLVLQVSEAQYSNTVPVDYIISQDPPAGEYVKTNAIVKVVISAGSKDVTMPDITKKDFYDAAIILKNAGLNIGEIKEVESEEKVGTILLQSPDPGTVVPPGEKCNITVSIGRFVTVPNVIGLNVNDAINVVTSAGLVIQKIDEVSKSFSVPKGIVLYQYPFPGAKVAQGALMLLKVSK